MIENWTTEYLFWQEIDFGFMLLAMKLLKSRKLNLGDGIGIFAPSLPAHVLFREKHQSGIRNLEKMGFRVIESSLMQSQQSQGYRSASAKERAAEFMELITNPDVKALVSTIGGYNSSSLIPYLDFQKIRAAQKVICGYSDVTSLHLAILHHAGLSTFYGPAVMASFGEYPDVPVETRDSFLAAVTDTTAYPRKILPPTQWSNHFRDAKTTAWKTIPRQYNENEGWQVLNAGSVTGELLVCNLNTLMSNAGTKHFPDFKNKILLIETASGDMGTEERLLRHLDLLGVFDQISGLIFGRIEFFQKLERDLTYYELIAEIVGKRPYPIIAEFDCSHTVPMLTLAQMCRVEIVAEMPNRVDFTVLEAMVS